MAHFAPRIAWAFARCARAARGMLLPRRRGYPRGLHCRAPAAAWCCLVMLVTAAATVNHGSAAPLEFLNLDQQARDEAINSVPADRLTPDAREKINEVLKRPTIYRRLPVTVVRSDPEMYLFLVRHPEVVVNMWDVMGITKVSVDRTGPYTFAAHDGAGTTCDVELLYGDRDVHVLYSEGRYQGPLLRRLIEGRCVLILNSQYAETQDGTVHVTSRLDMFVRLDNVGADILARTLHPLVGKSADHNFVESTRFLGQVSDAATKKLERLQRFSRKLQKVDNDVHDRFDSVAENVARRAAQRVVTMRVGDMRRE